MPTNDDPGIFSICGHVVETMERDGRVFVKIAINSCTLQYSADSRTIPGLGDAVMVESRLPVRGSCIIHETADKPQTGG